MATIDLRSVTKSFGPTRVLGGVDLSIADGEFLTLVGPSGCGKSTLLRILAGLEPQDEGVIAIAGRAVDHLRPHERKLAMVFQSYALYPHMTAADNIAMPLVMARLHALERLPILGRLSPRRGALLAAIRQEVGAVAAQLDIAALLGRKPAQLSGGQRQRVALGRAMVRRPDAFLMDEPLSNLDAKLRMHMRGELCDLHRRLGATFVYVTHDQVEAMTMSDRVAVMDEGAILQIGTPLDLYERPASLSVARFIGSPPINLFEATVEPDGRLMLNGRVLPLAVPRSAGPAVTLGIRPEDLMPVVSREAPYVAARVHRVEHLGADRMLHLRTATGQPAICRLAASAEVDVADSGSLAFTFAAGRCHLFGADGKRLGGVSIPDATPLARVGERR